jgi:hypothetical protein
MATPRIYVAMRRTALGLLDDAVDGHYVGLTDVDPELGKDRHQGLAKRVEVLL